MTTPQNDPIQPPLDHRGIEENGPFNPPKEFIQVTRGRNGEIAYIVNGKRVDEPR